MHKITILIADNHKSIRENWTYILNSDARFRVVAECGDAEEAVELAKNKRPDIILIDVNMTPISGFEATEKLRKFSPGSRVIGVSMHSQPAYARKMLQIGAKGFVTTNSSKEEMITAIREVYKGNKFVCEEIKNVISDQLLADQPDIPGIFSFTERETEIINYIKEGSSSKEIADVLNISLKTVEVYRHNILKKFR